MSRFITASEDVLKRIKKDPLLSKLIVMSAGFREGIDNIGFNVEKKPENKYFLKYCVAGRGYFFIDNMHYIVKPGDLIVCPANRKHGYGTDREKPWEAYWIYYSGDLASLYFNKIFDKEKTYLINIGIQYELINMFKKTIDVLSQGISLKHFFYSSSILSTIISYINADNIFSHSLNEASINKTVEYMNNNLDKKISLKELCEIARLSKDYYIKSFLEKFEYPPIDYFIRLKMQKACELLIISNMRILEIAKSLGYNDSLYFSRVFKKKIGKSPKAYRDKNKERKL